MADGEFYSMLHFFSDLCQCSLCFLRAVSRTLEAQCVKQAGAWVPLWPGSGQGPLREHLAPLPGSGSWEISPGHFCASPSLAEMWDPPKAKCGLPPGFSALEEAGVRPPNLCCSTLMSLCVLRFFFYVVWLERSRCLEQQFPLLFH